MKNIFFTFLLLPFILTRDLIRSRRSRFKKIGLFIIVLLFFFSLWWNSVQGLRVAIGSFSYSTGLRDRLTNITVSGESMLPSIKDGQTITLKSPKKYGLAYGDVVSFQNDQTGALHFGKRIIGLPGDSVVLKNGYVYINDKVLEETYTLNQAHSYGNTFLSDCEKIQIPADSFFVMGDNRIVSFDSRAIGFVKKDDIDGVIKNNLKSSFLETADQKKIEDISLDPVIFLQKLNEKRKSIQKPFLVTHQALNNLSSQRAEEISQNLDSWKKQGISINTLLDQKGYRYNLVHEYVTFGYLTEDDILAQILDITSEKDQFLSPQYTEVGIGITKHTIGQCTYPVISIILSWPVVPTYDQQVIDSWLREIQATNKILVDLQSWIGFPQKDQTKLRQAIDLAASENQIATKIYNKMKSAQWLNANDQADIRTYDSLVKESGDLINELFPKNVQGLNTDENETPRRL